MINMSMCNQALWGFNLILIFALSLLFILEIVRYINQKYHKSMGLWSSFWAFTHQIFYKVNLPLNQKLYQVIVLISFPFLLFCMFLLAFNPIISFYGAYIVLIMTYFFFLSLLGLFWLQEKYISQFTQKFQIVFMIGLIIVLALSTLTFTYTESCLI